MKKTVIVGSILFVCLLTFIVSDYLRFSDGKLHVTFCDIGQGDAVLIRTPSGKNILYDGGPDRSVLSCLSKHMPFWDRTLHQVILSHPHEDHFAGIYYLIDRYRILSFDTVELNNETSGFQIFLEKIKKKNIQIRHVFRGDTYKVGDVTITVLGPSREYLDKTSPNGQIGESKEFASAIVQVTYKDFDLMLTGDSQVSGLKEIWEGSGRAGKYKRFGELKDIEILHVPHHGSRFGLDEKIVEQVSPTLAVISVGKNNYGHPSREILKILGEKDMRIVRTDQMGDVAIVSDGKNFYVKQ